MKKVFILILLLSAARVHAQSFEGIIVWKITSEITDPAVKAQMEEAQKRLNDPETKAQMKQMEEKLNDPQFKAMLDANPQLKTQMEAMKAAQAGGGGLADMMPKSYTIKFKNQNTSTTMEGGMMGNMELLFLSDKNQTYSVDRKAKTYMVFPKPKEDEKTKMDVKVTKTSETARVMNHNCTKYISETTLNGHKMEQIFWTTTEIKDIDFGSLKNQRMGSQSIFSDKIDGVPLKMEMKMPQGTMIMEVTEIKKQSLAASDFAIPSDFKETKPPSAK